MMKWAAIPALFAVVACQDKPIDEGLASDLALIAGSDLELANAGGAGALVISPVENIAVPSPKLTPSPSKAKGKKAPPPTEVAVDAAADEPTTTTPELVAVSESETPEAAETPAPDAPPIVRPRPIEPRYPVGSGSVYGSGRDEGVGHGGVTVVIRGGRTGHDPCDLHDIARRPGRAVGVMINNRVPTGTTFPRR